jgi:hypothetical protein
MPAKPLVGYAAQRIVHLLPVDPLRWSPVVTDGLQKYGATRRPHMNVADFLESQMCQFLFGGQRDRYRSYGMATRKA